MPGVRTDNSVNSCHHIARVRLLGAEPAIAAIADGKRVRPAARACMSIMYIGAGVGGNVPAIGIKAEFAG